MNWISKACRIYQADMVLCAVDLTGCLKVVVFHKSHIFFSFPLRDSNQWITMGCQIPMLNCTCCLELVRYVPALPLEMHCFIQYKEPCSNVVLRQWFSTRGPGPIRGPQETSFHGIN